MLFELRYLLLELLRRSVPESGRASYLFGPGASEGREHKPLCGGGGGDGWGLLPLGDERSSRLDHLAPMGPCVYTAGMQGSVNMSHFIAFEM